ncbi:MAG TPA: hypothetical protein VK139_04645 [Microbacteriaceae bacterium]|nr:hypothetical protein [Microbacteriaceae bacterium]
MNQSRIKVFVSDRDQSKAIWGATELANAGDIVELCVRSIEPIDYRLALQGAEWAGMFPWYRPELHWQITSGNAAARAHWRELLDALAAAHSKAVTA